MDTDHHHSPPEAGNGFSIPLSADLLNVLATRVADLVAARLARSTFAPTTPWLDVDAVAEYASMTPDAVRAAAKRHQLRAFRSNTGRLRFRTEDVDRFLMGEAA